MEKRDVEPFLRDLMKKNEELRTMKIILLGNGRIGKITLVRAFKNILNTASSEVRSSAILILQFEINKYNWSTTGSYYKHSGNLDNVNLARRDVTLFDFAGQMEYTATHQFFLSSLVCIVIKLIFSMCVI